MTKEQYYEKYGITDSFIKADLEAVIATEIAKVQEQPQPEEPKGNCTTFDMSRLVDQKYKPTEQPAPFDKERFEAMFRAVVASGRNERWEQDLKSTKFALAELDAYYATKEGGENG